MNYRLEDLIDPQQFQMLQDRLNEIYSFPSAIIDLDGKVLTATAWQDICTQFHRKNKECEKACIKSDQYIAEHLSETHPVVSYRCPHGLIDNAAPIIIGGKHYGNFFTGQFFLEPPDLNFFRAQAKRYGFDENKYLEAVRKVPVWTQEQLNSYLYFIKGLIEVIANIGLKNLQSIETQRVTQASEERYRQIFDYSPVGIAIVGLNKYFRNANQRLCQILNYTEEELRQKTFVDLTHPKDTAAGIQGITRLMNGELEFFTQEKRYFKKGGDLIWSRTTVRLIKDVEQHPHHFLTTIEDITNLKQAELSLSESEAKYRALIETTATGYVIVDSQGVVLDANQEYVRLTGRNSLTDILGHCVTEWTAPYDQVRNAQEVRKCMNEGFVRNLIVHYSNLQGHITPIEINASVLSNEEKTPQILAVCRDISERVKAQERLNQSLEEKEILLSEVHHRVKNNLNVITSLLQLQSLSEKNKTVQGLFEKVENRIRSIALVHDQLYRSLEKGKIDCESYFKSLIQGLSETYNTQELGVEFELKTNFSLDLNHAIPCGLIINELVTNSLKYAFGQKKSGRIQISISHVENQLPQQCRLEVSDNGIGFSALPNQTQNAGKGLEIVRNLVKQLQGRIEFICQEGSTIKIDF